jgi:hypothetical protein
MPDCFSHVPFFLLSLSCGSGDFIAFCESNSLANFPFVFNPVRVGLLAGAPPPPLHLKNVPHRMFGGGGEVSLVVFVPIGLTISWFMTRSETRGAHRSEEQWNTRDTSV